MKYRQGYFKFWKRVKATRVPEQLRTVVVPTVIFVFGQKLLCSLGRRIVIMQNPFVWPKILVLLDEFSAVNVLKLDTMLGCLFRNVEFH